MHDGAIGALPILSRIRAHGPRHVLQLFESANQDGSANTRQDTRTHRGLEYSAIPNIPSLTDVVDCKQIISRERNSISNSKTER